MYLKSCEYVSLDIVLKVRSENMCFFHSNFTRALGSVLRLHFLPFFPGKPPRFKLNRNKPTGCSTQQRVWEGLIYPCKILHIVPCHRSDPGPLLPIRRVRRVRRAPSIWRGPPKLWLKKNVMKIITFLYCKKYINELLTCPPLLFINCVPSILAN